MQTMKKLLIILFFLPSLALAQNNGVVNYGVSVSGAVTPNDCVKFQSPWVIQDAGTTCGGGGGSGTVNSGTANQSAFYATSGTAVSGTSNMTYQNGGATIGTGFAVSSPPLNGAIIQGNVAIGTSSNFTNEDFEVHVSNAGHGVYADGSTGNGPTLGLSLNGGQVANFALAQGGAQFSEIATSGDIVVRLTSGASNNFIFTNQTSGPITFATGSSSSNDTAKMMVLANGNVVIGTTIAVSGAGTTIAGHIGYAPTNVPAVTSCGGGTLTAGSTDNKGSITGISAATSCVVTFSSALPAGPACILNTSTGIAVGNTATTSGFTSAMALFTGTLYYICQ